MFGKKKEAEKKVSKNMFDLISGLPKIHDKETIFYHIDIENGFLSIQALKLYFSKKSEILQEYRIPVGDVLAFDIVEETHYKQKSALKRGVAGALLFGPVGAIIGGASGLDKSKIKETLGISYLSAKGDEPQTSVFNLGVPGWTAFNTAAIKKLKEEVENAEKSERAKAILKIYNDYEETDDGAILL